MALGPVRKDVAIIGGGFSGTVLALQLLKCSPELSLAVIDNRSLPGAGLAYGTAEDCHLLNVPAGQMSAFPSEPDHFIKWAEKHYTSAVEPGSFLPRTVYGRYLASLLNQALAWHSSHDLEWVRDEALSVQRNNDGVLVQLKKSGPPLLASKVVLALGNFQPGDLTVPGLTLQSRYYKADAWSEKPLENLNENCELLLIGTGLTSMDLAMSLHSRSFKGKIHMLSRHGLAPCSHAPCSMWRPFWTEHSPRSMRGLLRVIREQVEAASEAGCDWRAVIDSLRPCLQSVWQSLPLVEQRRFLRHLRPYWEVHRHRMAPEIAQVLSELQSSGQLVIHAGRIMQYSEDPSSSLARVTFRQRSGGATHVLEVARIINCSGPQTNLRRTPSPLLKNLLDQGLARQDPLALGLDTDQNGALLGQGGIPSSSIFALGPIRKGQLWETTAVPELRMQASELADYLCRTEVPQVNGEQTPRAARSETYIS